MKRAAFVIAAVLAVAFAGGAQAGQPADLHCPDGWVTKIEAGEVEDLNDYVPDAGVLYCVKASTGNTGILTGDGKTPAGAGLDHDVSYIVIYQKGVQPSASPQPSPSSSTPPLQTPSPSPSASPTPRPSPESTSSPSPTPAPTTPTPSNSPTLPPSPTITLPPTDAEGAAADEAISDTGLLLVALVLLGGAIIAGAMEYADRRNER